MLVPCLKNTSCSFSLHHSGRDCQHSYPTCNYCYFSLLWPFLCVWTSTLRILIPAWPLVKILVVVAHTLGNGQGWEILVYWMGRVYWSRQSYIYSDTKNYRTSPALNYTQKLIDNLCKAHSKNVLYE